MGKGQGMGTHLSRGSGAAVASALTLLVLVVIFALTACGGSDVTTSSSPAAAPSEAATSPSPSWSPTMAPAAIPVVKPGQKPPPFSELRRLFAYDTSEPLDFKEVPSLTYTKDGVTLSCVTYQSEGRLVNGFLVMPEGEGPFPVVVYAPGWLTSAKMWDADAVKLSRQGYAGLLLGEPSIGFNFFDAPKDIASEAAYVIQERRALDLLATLPKIDSERIGFVGWSHGAGLGTLLAGVEDRIKAYALIGVGNTTTYGPEARTLLKVPKGAAFKRWAAGVSVIDSLAYVRHNKTAAFLFLNGRHDWEAMHDAKAFLAAAPEPKTWHVYEGYHDPMKAGAMGVWRAWILKSL